MGESGCDIAGDFLLSVLSESRSFNGLRDSKLTLDPNQCKGQCKTNGNLREVLRLEWNIDPRQNTWTHRLEWFRYCNKEIYGRQLYDCIRTGWEGATAQADSDRPSVRPVGSLSYRVIWTRFFLLLAKLPACLLVLPSSRLPVACRPDSRNPPHTAVSTPSLGIPRQRQQHSD